MNEDFFVTFSEEEKKVIQKVVKEIRVSRLPFPEKGNKVPKDPNKGKNKKGYRELKRLNWGMRDAVHKRRQSG